MEGIRVPPADTSGDLIKTDFKNFLKNYQGDDMLSSKEKFLANYFDQLFLLAQNGGSTLFVDFRHIVQYEHEMAEAIQLHYCRFEPFLCLALQELLIAEFPHLYQQYVDDMSKRVYFVAFYNLHHVNTIRAMRSEKIGKLMSIGGTVTRSSEVRPELLYGHFICKKCGAENSNVEQQYQFTAPHICITQTCASTEFQMINDLSVYVDWQRLRVQENAEEIPAGSMPRCIDVICRNEAVEYAKAGDKVVFTGTVAVIADTSGLARAGETTVSGKTVGRGENYGDGLTGLRKMGVKEMTYKMLFIASSIVHIDQSSAVEQIHDIIHNVGSNYNRTAADISDGHNLSHSMKQTTTTSGDDMIDNDGPLIMDMYSTPNLYSKMAESICPSIFGHNEVKRGILLMLFSGVHKQTKEGIPLRGDINVCIVGDPSCAKSQFLKYVHGFLPHTVYTSGKSSSAAGLTASVVRDNETGEQCIEAGALMLADNGICCIDEFDKMDTADQVAIHEAMEQQTISITKAGIQATLNARTSILAAANPVFGRYDRTKPLKSNVNISPAIMSRFDLFFVVLDECNPVTDELIARHIINSHRFSKYNGGDGTANKCPFTTEQMQKYIKFAKTINPAITKESRQALVECYRLLRQNDILGKNNTAYRITVRQLESLIRLSEALARLHLNAEIDAAYVREAYRLLQKSIIFVENEDIDLEENQQEMNNTKKSRTNEMNVDDDDDSNAGADHGNNTIDNEHDFEDPMNNIIDLHKNSEAFGNENNLTYSQDSNKSKTNTESDLSMPALREKINGNDSANQINNKRKVDPSFESDHFEPQTHKKENIIAINQDVVSLSTRDTKSSRTDASLPKDNKKVGSDKPKKSQISAKQYEEMTYLISLFLKKNESLESHKSGTLWSEVVTYYMQQREDTEDSLIEFEAKQKTVNQVIRRMIKHDGIVVVVEGHLSGDYEDNQTKYLKLHPSYEP